MRLSVPRALAVDRSIVESRGERPELAESSRCGRGAAVLAWVPCIGVRCGESEVV